MLGQAKYRRALVSEQAAGWGELHRPDAAAGILDLPWPLLTKAGKSDKGQAPRNVEPVPRKQKPRGGSPRGASWINYVARIIASRITDHYFLEIHPELDIAPLLIVARTQVVMDVRTGPQIAVGGLESQLAVHHHVGPGEVQFISDMLLGIVRS